MSLGWLRTGECILGLDEVTDGKWVPDVPFEKYF